MTSHPLCASHSSPFAKGKGGVILGIAKTLIAVKVENQRRR